MVAGVPPHTAPGGGARPADASCSARISRARATSTSSPAVCGGSGLRGTSPGTNDSTSRPCSSTPSGSGAPVNPASRRCARYACTVRLNGRSGRRTVSPIRTIPWVTPSPVSGSPSLTLQQPSLGPAPSRDAGAPPANTGGQPRIRPVRELAVAVVVAQFDAFDLAAEQGHIEELIGRAEQLDDRAVAGPGTQDGAAIPVENAEAALLAGPGRPRLTPVGQLLCGPEVVFDRHDAFVVGHVEVVVEVVSQRRIPREGPAHPLPERLDRADRRPGYRRVRGVAGLQVSQVADVVGLIGADRAASVPGRVEHEVLDDELGPALEEIQQAGLAVRALEYVVLLHRDSGQPAEPGRDLPEGTHRLFLGGLQFLARGQPLGGRDYSWAHVVAPSSRRLHLPAAERVDGPGARN